MNFLKIVNIYTYEINITFQGLSPWKGHFREIRAYSFEQKNENDPLRVRSLSNLQECVVIQMFICWYMHIVGVAICVFVYLSVSLYFYVRVCL